ncbi:MAG: signal recognition particle protein [Candidatus Puniceispirillaceae bacterium]
MFDSLKDKLQSVFTGLGRKGALSQADVDAGLSEVRKALLEADVALPVVRHFMAEMKEKAVGASVLKSVRPDQQVIKLVNDSLTDMLGGTAEPLMVDVAPPAIILMAGLQGSGKTTTAGKLAIRLKNRQKKKVMLASLDLTRPAAREQLRLLSEQAEAGILTESETETPVQLAKRAVQSATLQGYDVVILDTAGRLAIDEALMAELRDIKAATNPHEILLVADSLTGQDAVQTAQAFHDAVGVTGIVLTRLDGDARGGAALSMRHVTGCPIKLVGTGEKLDALEEFHPERMAGRILDMGDVVALVEKASEAIEAEEAERMARRMAKGQFDMNDFLAQLKQLQKMGGLGGILGMLPGLGKMQKQIAAAGVDDTMIKRQEAIILSMNKRERQQVGLLNASRRKRIAAGSGTTVQDVNKLVKQYQDMARMMKKMNTKQGAAAMKAMMGGGGLGGGMGGGMPSAADMQKLSQQFNSGSGGGNLLGGMNPFGGKGGLPGLGQSPKKK